MIDEFERILGAFMLYWQFDTDNFGHEPSLTDFWSWLKYSKAYYQAPTKPEEGAKTK